MKRLGYPPHYAGAIETVASTGGVIMPPVMGTIAFVIVIMTNIPYATVLVAAIIPALLYYFGLLIQVDSFAARAGLKGMPREEIPSLMKTIKEGWPFIFVLAFLVFGLIYMRWDVRAPVYASALMILLSFTRRETMMTPRRLIGTLATVGNLISYIMAVFLPIGVIMVAMSCTGTLAAALATFVGWVGVNVVVLLLIAMAMLYIFGMIGSGSTLVAYVVLAVTAIPSLVTLSGLNLLGLHLFVTYYLLMAGITPPVAVAAFIGAAVAAAPPMKTAWTAVRLAAVLYFVPFFFVLNPALIMQGPISETLYLFGLCLVGIWILASGLQGYLIKVGNLAMWERPLYVAGGFLIALPGWQFTITGAFLTAALLAMTLIRKRGAERKPLPT
jgi:TRAP transporter 4TM/12TM fusion protein